MAIKNSKTGFKQLRKHIGSLGFIVMFAGLSSSATAQSVSQQDIIDIILKRTTPTSEQIQQMDANGDGVVDVADLVLTMRNEGTYATFLNTSGEVNEDDGTYSVEVILASEVEGSLFYSVGGLAQSVTTDEASADFSDPNNGEVSINGNRATITLNIQQDTVFEGDETLNISLMPGSAYTFREMDLGIRTHVLTIKESVAQTEAKFNFVLKTAPPGYSAEQLTSTDAGAYSGLDIFSKTISLSLTMANQTVSGAKIIENESRGVKDNVADTNEITATDVSYTGEQLVLQFAYQVQNNAFSSDASLTELFCDDGCRDNIPANGINRNYAETSHSLTVTINNFDVNEQRGYAAGLRSAENSATFYSDNILEGVFSQSIGDIHGGNDSKTVVGYVSGSLLY